MKPKNPIVVQKYGGTSLKDPQLLRVCAQNIASTKKGGEDPVVVVSAMGRRGDPYATDTFLDLAFGISKKPALRELDLLMACGELISATLLAVQLQELGCDAITLTGSQAGIVTTNRFGNAEILAVETKRIRQTVEAGKIPVICGFQGVSESGELTTLGRGGSDITAVAVAAALNLGSATIYTDVPAVKTADPKLVTGAQPIYAMNYQEIFEMAVEGAKVIHPRAVERAMADDVTLVITSLANGNTPPTKIGTRSGVTRDVGIIRAITQRRDISQFTITLESGELAKLLDEVAENEIQLDLISLSETRHSFTVSGQQSQILEDLLAKREYKAKRRDNCAKISLIGLGIRGVPGVMARIFRPMVEQKIPVYHTSDSFTQIALLIPEERLKDAVNSLHKEFFGEDD